MIKKQQKWIAFWVMMALAALLQVSSALPLTAGNGADQAAAANSERGPGYYEVAGQGSSAARKKSIVPYVLIGVGVAAVAAVLFLVG
jgi:hypothetical protein